MKKSATPKRSNGARTYRGVDAGASTRTVSQKEKRVEHETHPGNPRFVIVFSSNRPLTVGGGVCLAKVDEVTLGRGPTGVSEPTARQVSMRIDDDAMSRLHARLSHVPGGWELEDHSKNGTFVNGERVRRPTILDDGDVIELGETVIVYREDEPDTRAGRARASDFWSDLGSSRWPAFRTFSLELGLQVRNLARVLSSVKSVLVLGENGTGKELAARAVHEMSGRPGSFVALDCGAVPATMLASELFGHRRGAFTGAEDSMGLVRSANHGTLFLDEIANLSTAAQAILLRFLQEREVAALGAAGPPVKVDILVVAATNKVPEVVIQAGEFRRDLYERLAGFELRLPSLRERREDLGILIGTILRNVGDDAAEVTFDRAAERALLEYNYPGNIRELDRILQRALPLADGRQIQLEHLPESTQTYQLPMPGVRSEEDAKTRARLLELLEKNNGNLAEVARRMDKMPEQIRRWCRRFKIDFQSFRRQ